MAPSVHTRPVDSATLLVAAGFGPIATVSFVFWIPLALGASLLLDGAYQPR